MAILHPEQASFSSPTPAVAVVILNWNGKGYLEKFLPSVTASTYPNLEIIVADNHSTDDSITFLNTQYPAVKTLVFEKNHGFAGGYNLALKQVAAEILILLNSDVEVEKDWIEPLVAMMVSDGNIGACQPKMRAYHDRSLLEYAGAAGGWLDKYGFPFARGRVFDHCEKDNGQYDEAQDCFWASGAALVVRNHVFQEAGGFDPYFFAHQEEIDLCWRIQLMGYRVVCEPASVVYHVGGGTLPASSPRKTYLNFRNNMIMLWKNLPVASRWWIIWCRLFMNGVAALKMLLSGDLKNFMAVVRGHWGFVQWIFMHRKESVFPADREKTLHGVYKGNVVIDYYLRGKKLFSEIVSAK